jgi:hypothetical protein
MDNTNSFVMALIPVLSSLAYLARDENFSWLAAMPLLLPTLVPVLLFLPSPAVLFNKIAALMKGTRPSSGLDFVARLRLRDWGDEPDAIVRVFSVNLWEWNRLGKTVNCRNLMEEAFAQRYWNDDPNFKRTAPIFVDDAHNPFWNADRPDIKYTMWVERHTDREGNNHAELFVRIHFDAEQSPHAMVEHIEMLRKSAERIEKARATVQRVLVSTDKEVGDSRRDDGSRAGPNFMVYEFATTSKFENFFSQEAAIVKADLDVFLKGKAAYERTGRPWTYTVMNEGPPGVGKTKLVKAIAAYTGSTLIVLNLHHIKDLQTLYDAFHSSVLGGENVPHDRRIYYIPEVDTQMFEMLEDREKKGSAVATRSQWKKTATAAPAPADADMDAVMIGAVMPPAAKKPTLGEILNVLDGVPERHGHILVLDTNHLAKLDPALIRPGRVDRIVSWRKMDGENVRRYIENLFSMTIPKTVVFPDDKWTAAELQALAHAHGSWDELQRVLFVGEGGGLAEKLKRLGARRQ